MKTFLEILIIILGILVIVACSLGVNWLFTYGLIWAINGICSVDYWEKFWYVFWGIWIIQWILGSNVKRS